MTVCTIQQLKLCFSLGEPHVLLYRTNTCRKIVSAPLWSLEVALPYAAVARAARIIDSQLS